MGALNTIAELNRLAQDTGCDSYDDCLTCPFSKCRYDTNIRSAVKDRRYREMLDLYKTMHLSPEDIAKLYRVSLRTVQRALKEAD